MFLALSYFNKIFGPLLFSAIPVPMPEDLKEEVLKYMNINIKKGIITGTTPCLEKKVKIISLPFVIPSSWGRGNVEMLMLSLIVEKDFRTDLFQDVLYNLSQKIHDSPEMYKAFYKDDIQYSKREGIANAIERLNEILSSSYSDIKKIIDNPNLGIFLTLGLSKAGKSTILHYLKTDAFKDMKPTLALHVIKILFDNKIFRTVDVSGQKRLRSQWWSYTKTPDAIIFVIDINDPANRLKEVKSEFSKLEARISNKKEGINNNIPILICLNKIDLIDNIDKKKSEIMEILPLDSTNLNYKVQLTSAKEGTGITEGIKWIFKELLKIS